MTTSVAEAGQRLLQDDQPFDVAVLDGIVAAARKKRKALKLSEEEELACGFSSPPDVAGENGAPSSSSEASCVLRIDQGHQAELP